MAQLPTAEEFLRKNIDYVLEKDCKEDVQQAMIEFARLQVEKALKEQIKLTKKCIKEKRSIPTFEFLSNIKKAFLIDNIK